MDVSPPTLQLRAARETDAAKVARCYLASCRSTPVFSNTATGDTDVEAWVRDELIPHCHVTVAIESGGVVGFIAVAHRDEGDWIEHLHVHPARLRRGIGSTLLQVALMRLTGAVRLHTLEENRVGRRFFERYGFAAVAVGEGPDGPDVLYERAAIAAA